MLGRLGPFHVVPGQTISTYSSPVWNFIGNPWEFPKKNMVQHQTFHDFPICPTWPRLWVTFSKALAIFRELWLRLILTQRQASVARQNVHRPPGKTGKTPGTSPMTPIFGEKTWRWFLLVPVRLNFVEQTQLQKNPPRTSICWLFKQGQPPINNGKQW